MSRTIVGVFDNYDNAENAARQIKDQGLRTADISIVAKQHGDNTAQPSAAYSTSPYNGLSAKSSESMITSHNNASNVAGNIGNVMGMGASGTNRGALNDNISDGATTGGVLGGLAGLFIGAGSMVVPGLGIIAAAGPITGLISGAVTGGIVGGLVDLGIPENNSRQYETDVKAGKILFSMKTDDDKIDQVASILRNDGAASVDSY